MRVVRYIPATKRRSRTAALDARWGLVEGDRVQPITDPFRPRPSGRPLDMAHATLVAPVVPSKIIGVAANYPKHAAEMGNAVAEEPRLFLKAPSAIVGPGDAIRIPPRTERVDPEGELAVVIGRTARCVSEAEALSHVLGYTIGNDVTARDFQATDRIFGRAKSFDTFCPIGPWIETGIDASDLEIALMVDGEARARGRTSEMTHSLTKLIAFVSGVMTLHPGDVILTGTPPGVAPIAAGNRVSIAIEGIGTLENPVENRDDRA